MAHLILVFHERSEFERASEWFDTDSCFYSDRKDEQTRSLYFEDSDIDCLEMALTDELEQQGFEGYYFREDF